MKILAIETSCDETGCAIVENGTHKIADVVASSAEFHKKTGGIVPEIASRKQVESIIPVIETCLKNASIDNPQKDIDAIAVTVGPGLIGSLLVGVSAAKSLALSWGKPLIPVNHLIGHIYGNFIDNENEEKIKFPAVVLIVSGGHTDLVLMKDHGDITYLGGTLDDAAGEAFDKVARMLGFSSYLGGPQLSKKASECSNNTLRGVLPRPMLSSSDYDFSFSGLKTAVRNIISKENPSVEAISCEFETAVVDVLVEKTIKAAKNYNASSIILGGGVSANGLLRARIQASAELLNVYVALPPLSLCGDTAAYIASAAYFNNKPVELNLVDANPSLSIMD